MEVDKTARIGELGQKVIENPEFPQPKVNIIQNRSVEMLVIDLLNYLMY